MSGMEYSEYEHCRAVAAGMDTQDLATKALLAERAAVRAEAETERHLLRKRQTLALESIARSLEKLANPLQLVDVAPDLSQEELASIRDAMAKGRP